MNSLGNAKQQQFHFKRMFQSVFALRASPDTTLRQVALRGCATRSHLAKRGGARRDRTADLLHAMQALSQLSYGPITW